jgi:hypothetical protein
MKSSKAHANPVKADIAVPGSDEYASHQDKHMSDTKRSAGLVIFKNGSRYFFFLALGCWNRNCSLDEDDTTALLDPPLLL